MSSPLQHSNMGVWNETVAKFGECPKVPKNRAFPTVKRVSGRFLFDGHKEFRDPSRIAPVRSVDVLLLHTIVDSRLVICDPWLFPLKSIWLGQETYSLQTLVNVSFFFLNWLTIGWISIWLFTCVCWFYYFKASDPYCIIHHGRNKVQSQYIKKTLNPSWNENFLLPISDASIPIQIECFDKDLLSSHDSLGKATFPVSSLIPEQRTELWVKVPFILQTSNSSTSTQLKLNIL